MGLVFNVRFTELFDLLGGLFCLDLCGDDGTGESKWPWQPKGAQNSPPRTELPY